MGPSPSPTPFPSSSPSSSPPPQPMDTQTQHPPAPALPPLPPLNTSTTSTASTSLSRPPSTRYSHSAIPASLLQAAFVSATAMAAANATASPDDTDDEYEPSEPRARRLSQASVASNISPTLLEHLVHTVYRLSNTAGMKDSGTKPAPRDSDHTLHWLVDELERLNIHLQRRPSRSDVGSVSSRRRSKRGSSFLFREGDDVRDDGLDGLDGLEDCKVDSEDDLGNEQQQGNAPRRSSARRSRLGQRGRSVPNYDNLPPVLELASFENDVDLLSARSSQGQLEGRPPPRLPIGSAANSYITQISSWKSLGGGDSTKFRADYNKLFPREDATPLAPGESSIAIAAGTLFNPRPITERWNIGVKIGEGGYSTVHFATIKHATIGDLSLDMAGNMAAVKVISKKRPELYNEKMVTREVFSFRLLRMAGGHENIVELYEVYEDSSNVYLVMELLAGGDLFASIAERDHYTERDAANLVVSMLAGLSCCHRLNLKHRDVKPENFVFKDNRMNDDLKLTDFGIAHYSEDPSALCKTLCGTPLYVAPEVLLRQPYGPAADLWSLGVIIYIMLVGYPPFDDNDIVQLVKRIKYRAVTFEGPEWVLISDEGKKFLANLLDKDPSNRMTAHQALEHEWLKNNCQAATVNVLEVAQTNIKTFVNRKRWKAAIQGVKAMNRIHKMVELARDEEERQNETTGPGDEKIEIVSVRRPEGVESSRLGLDDIDDDIGAFSARIASSSSEEEFVTARRTPLSGSSSRSGRPPPMPRKITSIDRKRSSSLIQSVTAKAQLKAGGENGISMVLPPIDPAFESSGELTSNFPKQRIERAGARVTSYSPLAAHSRRMETSPYIGSHTSESESGRVSRTMSRDGGVMRKMSTSVKRIAEKGRKAMAGEKQPVMIEMGEHRKKAKFFRRK